jgi:integrase
VARRSTGQVISRQTKTGRKWALRFRAYGCREYLTLGHEADGWTRGRAQQELENVLADVRRGLWIPPDRGRRSGRNGGEEQPNRAPEPNFHRFASDWLASRRSEVSKRTYDYYMWALTYHLLPYFSNWKLAAIDIEAVDAYRGFKLAQGETRRAALEAGSAQLDGNNRPLRPLAPATINKTIDVLQAVLALAVEYERIPRNPASGRRRRLKVPARPPIHLDTADQIQILLDAAGNLDERRTARTSGRRALIATLVLAGLRAGEASQLRWRDVDLANGRLRIARSKTRAGLREVSMLALLRDELGVHKAATPTAKPDSHVFTTATGRPRDKDNIRTRVLQPAVLEADELLRGCGLASLPPGLTPHSLRHTFASVLVAAGEDPASVMAQLGHTDPKFTLRVYGHVMRRGKEERARLKALVGGSASGHDPLLSAGQPTAPSFGSSE